MQNDTHAIPDTPDVDLNNANLETDVHDAVTRNENVEDSVRKLTYNALSAHAVDLEGLRAIIHAVVEGARRGAQQEVQLTAEQIQAAQERLTKAISGLDVALAQFAQASKLTVEEAMSRAHAFGQEDLAKVRTDLESLEALFLDTLKNSANATGGFIAETLQSIVSHAELQGTAAGAQIKDTLNLFGQYIAQAGLTQIQAGRNLAYATADMMRNITAGVLSGLADSLKKSQSHDQQE